MKNRDEKHWLEPVLKRHLAGVEAPEDAWRQMRSVASIARQETPWAKAYLWPAAAAAMVLLVAAGGHSYFKAGGLNAAADSEAVVQAANPAFRNESNAAAQRGLAPGLKLEVQSACRLCHTTAQL